MNLELISHASLKVSNNNGKILVTDPWYISPVFWSSWFLCPEPNLDQSIYYKTDYIYLTHWHFDHFDYKTLRKFKKEIKIFVPKFPSSIMKNELKKIGFVNIYEIEHNKELELDDKFSIISHQTEYQDDSILIIKVDGKIIINLNDAKPLPSSWNWLMKNFKNPFFLFRSHSIAWSYPTKYHFFDEEIEENYFEKSIYMKDFLFTINKMNPKYAVPHASYICHLHRETLDDNKDLITPYELEKFIKNNLKGDTIFKIMNPGGKYSDEKGFYDIKDYNFIEEIKKLQIKYSDHLEKLYTKEENYIFEYAPIYKYFRDFISKLGIFRFLLNNYSLLIKSNEKRILINFKSKKISLLNPTCQIYTKTRYSVVLEVHKSIILKAVKNFIFSNIDISKRCKFIVNKESLKKHLLFLSLISLYEGGILPLLPNLFKPRFVFGYFRRLPELLDTIKLFMKLKKSVNEARSMISSSE